MKRTPAILPIAFYHFLAIASIFGGLQAVLAHETGGQHVHFQKPRRTAPKQQLTFQAVSQVSAKQLASPDKRVVSTTQLKAKEQKEHTVSAAKPSSSQDPFPVEHIARKLKQQRQPRDDRQVASASYGRFADEPSLSGACDYCGSEGACEPGCGMMEAGCGMSEPGCGMMEAGCGMSEPGCGMIEAGCRMSEPGCGMMEAGCGMSEPGCGIAEPGCGLADECGSCVGPPVPEYWCFPVCLPRFKVLNFWIGVHSFRDMRDFVNADCGTANYGFQEGVNIGGRAPLIGRMFPQLGYQLGYQATQSRLSGTTTSSNSRFP